MIKSFANKGTEDVYNGVKSKAAAKVLPRNLAKVAGRKLDMVQAAAKIDDLFVPPSNKLEKLKGNRAGQWSIRINRQWRVVFTWDDGHAHNVEVVDYH